MIRYLVKQALLSLVKLFVFVTIMFFLIQIMMPGDFVDQFSLTMNQRERDALREELGLNLPIWQRYLRWMGQILRLDFGESFSILGSGGPPVSAILKTVIPPTLLVFCTGTALAFLIGLWLGKVTAWSQQRVVSGIVTLGSLALFTSFPPWMAWLVTQIFSRQEQFTLVGGSARGLANLPFPGLDRELWRDSPISPDVIAFRMFLTLLIATVLFVAIKALAQRYLRLRIPGLVVILLIAASAVGSWYVMGTEKMSLDIVNSAWIALVTYTIISFGETMLIMRSSMTDVMQEEYVNTAKAKGLPSHIVRERHAARNALLPVLSRLVISLPYLTTGIVIVESALNWPGIGTALWNSLYWQNMPVVMAILLIVGVLSLFARLVLDVLAAYLDPRIRHGEEKPIAI
ncbi:MAG: ABC transporter permease [Anaerolineae bacterium]|nr:ABC transporter permease [Anaerolineae bacterium]